MRVLVEVLKLSCKNAGPDGNATAAIEIPRPRCRIEMGYRQTAPLCVAHPLGDGSLEGAVPLFQFKNARVVASARQGRVHDKRRKEPSKCYRQRLLEAEQGMVPGTF